jgi:hypothetical protein
VPSKPPAPCRMAPPRCSGRTPALPYPPQRQDDSNKPCWRLKAINSWSVRPKPAGSLQNHGAMQNGRPRQGEVSPIPAANGTSYEDGVICPFE